MTTHNDSRVAYFSMEIALDPAMPTYSGGLGMLAGDTLRSTADLGVRMVAVTLLHVPKWSSHRSDVLLESGCVRACDAQRHCC